MDGIAEKVAEVYDVYPDQQSAAIFYSPSFIQNHTHDALKFMIAYLKGVRDYEEAFIKGNDQDKIVNILKKYINIESNDVWTNMTPVGLNPNGYINKKALYNDLVWYQDKGYINKIPDIERIIDHRYVREALGVIGDYR